MYAYAAARNVMLMLYIQPTRNAAIMMVVPDIEEEMYCPLQDSVMFVDPHASR